MKVGFPGGRTLSIECEVDGASAAIANKFPCQAFVILLDIKARLPTHQTQPQSNPRIASSSDLALGKINASEIGSEKLSVGQRIRKVLPNFYPVKS